MIRNIKSTHKSEIIKISLYNIPADKIILA